jgi:Ca2+-binding EF-hand superfamily protein
MSSEHHIDSFDVGSFFQLHDLNRDGKWDKEEIEAIYGVHHVYSQKLSKDDEEHKDKADRVALGMLLMFDLNKDGVITLKELEQVGLDHMPNFDNIGAEGHHYDVESEFFLHHEEKYHNTPETQTDESYNHPEDLEHFSHHEGIEKEEMERLAKFQGISVEELAKYQARPAPANESPKPKYTRVPPPEKQEPSIKFKEAEKEAKSAEEWGSGDAGYKVPREASERMRKNLPYKYKFRRNWGDF